MSKRRLGLIAVGAAAVAALTLGGSSLALAATGSPAAATVAPSAGSTTDSSTDQTPPASTDTAVTGAEADKVIAAVVAVDANASITSVRKDPDGSYDALGTSGGSPVFYDVSADLATVTKGGGGHGGPGGGGPGGASADTAVTGAEADKVIAAVVAKDANASITTVRKDPDGSYDALGTSGGSPVFYDVSADLATVTAGGGGHGGPGHGGPGGAADPGTGTGRATDSSTGTSGDAAGTNA
ncbi:MAG TPA: hypothetical protein VGK35_13065 [Actinotalea sp.]|jgi:hypothetical protein